MNLIKPLDMKYVSKPWGHEFWIVNNDKYCGKTLFIKQGRYCSFHWHEKKDKVLFIQSGEIWINYKMSDKEPTCYEKIKSGYAFHIRPGVKHQMEAIVDTTILEFSTHHCDNDVFVKTTDSVVDHSPEFSFGK